MDLPVAPRSLRDRVAERTDGNSVTQSGDGIWE